MEQPRNPGAGSRQSQQRQQQRGSSQPQQGQSDPPRQAGASSAAASQQRQQDIGRAAQAHDITGESNIQQSASSGSGQQQQFVSQSGQQSGGSGTDTRFADQIQPHMEVIDPGGAHIGTVDHVDGDRIRLTRSSSGSGEHEYLPLSEVAGIESGQVRLRYRGDTTFGIGS